MQNFSGLSGLGRIISDAVESAKSYFQAKIEECGGNIVLGILKGISDAILNIGSWIVQNIFVPFINGFKSAFGIASPSTVMAQQGTYIIQGLLQGMMNGIASVVAWLQTLPSTFINALGNAATWLVQKGTEAINGLKNGWESAKATFLAKVKNIKNEISSSIGNIKDALFQKGKDVVSGLVNGIQGSFSNIKQTAQNLAQNVADWLKNKLGIHSPSTVFYDIGTNMIEGLKNALTDKASVVEGAAEKMADRVGKKMDKSLDNSQKIIDQKMKSVERSGEGTARNVERTISSIRPRIPFISIDWSSIDFLDLHFSIPRFKLNWFANGGLFSGPSVIGVGEAGKEAVLPIEKPRVMKTLANSIVSSLSQQTLAKVPYMATGAYTPPRASMSSGGDYHSDDIEPVLRKVLKETLTQNQKSSGGTYTFIGQINRRVLFEEVIEEAKIRQTISGINPFEMG